MHDAEPLYARFRMKLLAFIQQRVADQYLAEDILHDVFVENERGQLYLLCSLHSKDQPVSRPTRQELALSGRTYTEPR